MYASLWVVGLVGVQHWLLLSRCCIRPALCCLSIWSVFDLFSVPLACSQDSVREGVMAFVKIITFLNNCAAQDVVPSSSCSLGRAGTVKDFKWLNHASAAYIVLSNGGLLCHGSLGEGLKDVMENVDAGPCLFLILFLLHLNLRHISWTAAMTFLVCEICHVLH
jgi:hypothetical protein